jgi:hypothetical protein
MIITGGKTNYGQDIGILMLDTIFPRIPGDIGNAVTFSFPVKYRVVKNAFPATVVEGPDRYLLPAFISAARGLEDEGVRAITTSCGFLAVFQLELAKSLRIPVFSSSLMQIPLIKEMLGAKKEIIVITANSGTLSEHHFRGVGADRQQVQVVGLEGQEEFYAVFVKQKQVIDLSKVENELSIVAKQVKSNFPQAGAIVFECTNLSPFRSIFREVTGLPVFDIVSLTNYVHDSLGMR